MFIKYQTLISRFSIFATGTLLLLSGILIAISTSAVAEPKRGGKIVAHINRDIGGFDHLKVPTGAMGRLQVLLAAHDLLFEIDMDTNKITPQLALDATSSNDFKNWRVTLRKGAGFSNGEEVTSEAYVHHFDRLLKSKIASRILFELGTPLKKVVAIDKYTMEFQFDKPHPSFKTIMASPKYMWYLNAPGFAKENENKPDYNKMSVGAGPYMVKEWIPGKGVTMVRNPHYWNPKAQHVDEIFYRITTGSENNPYRAALAGDIDVMWSFGSTFRKGVKEEKIDFIQGWRPSVSHTLQFTVSKEPVNDVRVRKAIAHAINRKALSNIIYPEFGQVSDEAFPPDSAWHCGNIKYPEFNPEKAKALLKEYGKPVKFELWALGIPTFKKSAVAIQAMLKKVGMEVDVKVGGRGPTGLVPKVNRGELAAWIIGMGVLAHPQSRDVNMRSDHKGNRWHIKSNKIDAAIDGLQAARTPEEVKKAHCNFEQAKADELPIVTFTYAMLGMYKQKYIKGLPKPNSINFGYHKVWIDK